MSRDNRRKRDLHALNEDGMVLCNPRDREAAHRAEMEGIATEDPSAVTCRKCLALLYQRRKARGEGSATSPDAGFLRSLRAAPEDDTVRLIYADWLDEQGDPRSEYLRLDTAAARRRGRPDPAQRQRLAELRGVLDREWVVTVSRSAHDVIKQLVVTIYPPSLGGLYKEREIKAPFWAEVEKSVRRLDRHRYPFVWLLLEEADDGKKFDIMGGKGAYVMWGRLDDREMRHHNPAGGDGYVDAWTSDQGYSAPEKDVCSDLETVVRVAKYVYYYRAFAPGVPWA